MSSSLIVVLQPRHGLDRDGLDFAAFARHYSRYHFCFLFLRVLRCFSSPRSPRYLFRCPAFSRTGCPIRVSADQVVFANPRGFSQLITPFFASRSQGIRLAPFSTFSCPDFTPRSIRQRIPRQESLRTSLCVLYSFLVFFFSTLPCRLFSGPSSHPSLAGNGHVRIPLAPAALCPLRQ